MRNCHGHAKVDERKIFILHSRKLTFGNIDLIHSSDGIYLFSFMEKKWISILSKTDRAYQPRLCTICKKQAKRIIAITGHGPDNVKRPKLPILCPVYGKFTKQSSPEHLTNHPKEILMGNYSFFFYLLCLHNTFDKKLVLWIIAIAIRVSFHYKLNNLCDRATQNYQ